MLEHKSRLHTSFFYIRWVIFDQIVKIFLKFEENITESLLIYVIFRSGYVIMITLKYQKSFSPLKLKRY